MTVSIKVKVFPGQEPIEFSCEIEEVSNVTMVPYGSTSVPYETSDLSEIDKDDIEWDSDNYTPEENRAIEIFLTQKEDEIINKFYEQL